MNGWMERREGVSRAGRPKKTLTGDGDDARRRLSCDCDACKHASMTMMRRMRRMGGAVTDDASRERARGR